MFGTGIVHEYDTTAVDPLAGVVHANVRHVVTVDSITLREAWKTFGFTFAEAGINPSSSFVNAIWPKAQEYIEGLNEH